MNHLKPYGKNIGLIGHVVAGFPTERECHAIVETLAQAGASAIEIQLPFSEPIADGPLFLAANQQALKNGMTVERSLDFISTVVQAHPRVVFIAMTYANVLYRPGLENMAARLARVGVRAVICPDWPIDAGEDLLAGLNGAGLGWIPLIAPSTTLERAKVLLQHGDWFAYVVAREGVTGSRSSISPMLKGRLTELSKLTPLPLGVGFGIQNRSDIAALKGSAQFAIIGSQSLQSYLNGGIDELKKLWSEFSGEASV